MKKILLVSSLASLLFLTNNHGYAQSVGISGTGSTPDASALLDVDGAGMTSPNQKGILIPRIALTSVTDGSSFSGLSPAGPATSLLIYNPSTATLKPAGYYYNSGTSGSPVWTQLISDIGNAQHEGTALSGWADASTHSDITIGVNSFFRITGPTTAFTITGFAGGYDGRLVTLYNTTAAAVTIANENTGSAATNRILTMKGADVVTPAGPNVIQLQYNATAGRWIVIGGQNIATAGSGGTSTNNHCFSCDGF